jgi:zinc protease
VRTFARGRRLTTALAALFLAALALLTPAAPAQALQIEAIRSPGGIEAWLVRDKTLPLVAIHFAFAGGSAQDPADKPGVASMVSALLDEGAGPYDSNAFHQALDDRAVEFRFTAERDYFHGSLRVLKEHRDEAFELLRLMLQEPRFEPKAVERIRQQILAGLVRDNNQPGRIAVNAWWAAAFPDHPYGHPVKGTLDSVPRITIDELKAFRQNIFARDGLKIALVGDISPEAAGQLLDKTFGGLAAKGERQVVADVTLHGIGRRLVHEINVPQATVVFGGSGLARKDPDFMAGYIVNHILGGGSFSSRLYEEVREKRGLAYSVQESLLWFRHAAFMIGSTATRSDRTAEALQIIEHEIARMRTEGPTADELAKAKAYLKGSYALSLDTSTKITAQLVQIQIDDLGIDYIDRRGAMIDAVTLDDAKRAAQRLAVGGLLVSVAGRPRGLTSKGPGG